jgi:magnesium chelatase accessory protein
MAHWDLHALNRDLPRLSTPLAMIVGANDRAVRPQSAIKIAERLPNARVFEIGGFGHLAHEEAPEAHARLIFQIWDGSERQDMRRQELEDAAAQAP